MKDLKVIFMGTPTFAVPILEALIDNTNVIMVVSQPDREKDRKGNYLYTPTKQIAIEHNIEVFQPISIKNDYQKIIDVNPEQPLCTDSPILVTLSGMVMVVKFLQ